METNEKLNPNSTKRAVILTVLTVLSGLISSLLFQFGLFIIPFTSAFFSALLLIEQKGKRRVSYAIPVVLCVIEFLINGIYSLNCLCSVIVALIIYFCFSANRAKSECAVYCTVTITFFIVISFVLSAFLITDSFNIETVVDFYINEIEAIKEEFVKIMLEFSNGIKENSEPLFEESQLIELFDATTDLLISYFVIIGFSLAGVAFKIFDFVNKKMISADYGTRHWSFSTSQTFVLFYYAIALVSMFVSNTSGVFSMTVMNLFAVFMFVYAYIGYKFVSNMLTGMLGKAALSKFIVICVVFFFSAFSIQMLSYIGALMELMSFRNKQENRD